MLRSGGGLVRRPGLVVLCLCVLLGKTAAAAGLTTGERLARQWCANCHIIGNSSPGPAQEGPPSFVSIARTGMTDAQLRAFLSHPHGQMPDLSLTRSEIEELIRYIDTLK
jgi:mono/diheme cytochrome c family protein